MKRVLGSIAATIVGLVALLSFKTHGPLVETVAANQPAGAANASDLSTSTSTLPSSRTKMVTGDSETTRWGPVQVKLTMTGSKITDVEVIQYPNANSRDRQINATAVPALVSQALEAQSAKIDGVSGATYTTQGFEASLQSALDQA